MNKLVIKRFFLALTLIVFFVSVTNISLSIGFGQLEQAMVTFEPNLVKSFRYFLVTTSSETLNYSLTLEGVMAQYVTLEPPSLKNIKPGENPWFTATIRFPSELPEEIKPGKHNAHIRLEEELEATPGTIGARSAALIRMEILVLYPGKYLSSGLKVQDINENENIKAEISIANYGKETINSITGTIEIFDASRTLVKTLYTDTKSLLSNTQEKLTATGSGLGLKPGDYIAKATITWDGKTNTAEDSFRIGTLNVAINEFTKEFEQEKINEFNVRIESFWNDILNDVYAEIEMGEETIKTPGIALEPWQKATLKGYWNTEGFALGEYGVKINVYYPEGRISTKEGKVTVIEKKEEPKTTTKDEQAKTEGFSITDWGKLNINLVMYILTIAVFVLIAFNVFWMKKKK